MIAGVQYLRNPRGELWFLLWVKEFSRCHQDRFLQALTEQFLHIASIKKPTGTDANDLSIHVVFELKLRL